MLFRVQLMLRGQRGFWGDLDRVCEGGRGGAWGGKGEGRWGVGKGERGGGRREGRGGGPGLQVCFLGSGGQRGSLEKLKQKRNELRLLLFLLGSNSTPDSSILKVPQQTPRLCFAPGA